MRRVANSAARAIATISVGRAGRIVGRIERIAFTRIDLTIVVAVFDTVGDATIVRVRIERVRGGGAAVGVGLVIAAGTPGQVAPLLGKTEAEVVDALKQGGFTAADGAKPLTEIATASGKDTMELMATLTALKAK